MEITHNEYVDKFDTKYLAASSTGYTIPTGNFEITDLLLNFLFHNEVKVNNTIDDIWLTTNFTANETIKFAKKPFFQTELCSTQSNLGPLHDPPKRYIH